MCELVYPMGIQIYDQVSILRSWSKVKLHRAVLIGFGLKEPKIALNIVKVGVHYYLPNAHLNLRSNFNFNKLVKSETPSCSFTKVGVKGRETSSEHPESWSAYFSSIFARVGIKGGPNSSEQYKILNARLPIKWASKCMIKFQF